MTTATASGSDMRRVLVVDDHLLLAQSLAIALRCEGALVHVADLTSEESILAAADQLRPDVVVLDLDLGGTDGERLIGSLVETGAQVLVVTACSDAARLGQCLVLGATAVLDKSHPIEILLRAVLDPAELDRLVSPADRTLLVAELHRRRAAERQLAAPFARLTRREREVLAGLTEGKSAETLANEFVVSKATVRTQINSVLRKLGVSSQLAAVAAARRARWSDAGG